MLASGIREAHLRVVEGRSDVGGRFVNIRRLGTDGGGGYFSLMFTATDRNSGGDAVLKIFNPEHANDAYRLSCFQRESDILQKLAGQRDIIQLVAPASTFQEMLTTAQGLAFPLEFRYYAVERASTDIASCVATGGLGLVATLEIFRAMCRCVQRIHTRKIAHRDLKPDQFLLMSDGSIRLGDFGTAILLDGTGTRLAPSYVGQPGATAYAAPEMLAGLFDADPEIAYDGDLYSLGAILFELLTGQDLGTAVFDPTFWDDLVMVMAHVHPLKRREVFDKTVDQIVAAHPMPSVRRYTASVPGSVATRLDRLYQALAHLDYRHRLRDFDRVFNEIRGCLIILRNEEAYRRWKAQRARLCKSSARKDRRS